jgi:hypothetical protein
MYPPHRSLKGDQSKRASSHREIPILSFLTLYVQCFESGSGLNRVSGSGSGRSKMTHKNRKLSSKLAQLPISSLFPTEAYFSIFISLPVRYLSISVTVIYSYPHWLNLIFFLTEARDSVLFFSVLLPHLSAN